MVLLFQSHVVHTRLLHRELDRVVLSTLADENILRAGVSLPERIESGALEQWKRFPNRNMEVVFRLSELQHHLAVTVRVFDKRNRTCICMIQLVGRISKHKDPREERTVIWTLRVKRRSSLIPPNIERLIERMREEGKRTDFAPYQLPKLQLLVLFRYINKGAKSL